MVTGEVNTSVLGVVQFCNTFHGEFPLVGYSTTLIRFARCNLKCSFCDTVEIMSTTPRELTPSEILSAVEETHGLLITGGEPGMYSDEVYKVVSTVISSYIPVTHVDIETNGLFIDRIDKFVDFVKSLDYLNFLDLLRVTWSPKFLNPSEIEKNFRRVYRLNKSLFRESVFVKLVNDPSFGEANEQFINLLERLYGRVYLSHVCVMPLTGVSPEDDRENVKKTLELCHRRSLNFSPRIHVVYEFA